MKLQFLPNYSFKLFQLFVLCFGAVMSAKSVTEAEEKQIINLFTNSLPCEIAYLYINIYIYCLPSFGLDVYYMCIWFIIEYHMNNRWSSIFRKKNGGIKCCREANHCQLNTKNKWMRFNLSMIIIIIVKWIFSL